MISQLDDNGFRITGAVVDIENSPKPIGKGLVKFSNRDVTVQDHYVAIVCRHQEHVRNRQIASFDHCKASIRKDCSRYINLKQDLKFTDGELEAIIKSVRKVYEAAKENWEKGGAV